MCTSHAPIGNIILLPFRIAAYTTALNYFTHSRPKLFLQDIERKDLLKFCAFLRDEKKQAPRIDRSS